MNDATVPGIGYRGWRCVRVGLLAGVAITAMEMLPMPVTMPLPERFDVARFVFLQWSVAAIGLAFVASWAEAHVRMPWLPLVIGAYALAVAVVMMGLRLVADALGGSLGGSVRSGHAPLAPTFFYNLWMTLFFGGLFLAAMVAGMRMERLRAARTARAIERNRSRALLVQARLDALQARVDPAFLLRVMTEVEGRYLRRAEDADRLLACLVAFLRHAMPGVRGHRVALVDELALAAAYEALWRELDPGRARIAVHDETVMAGSPFPSLWLLPVLDRWAEAAPRGAHGTLVATRHESAIRVTLAGDAPLRGPWLTRADEQRARAALAPVLGERWTLTFDPDARAGAPVLVLELLQETPSSSPALVARPSIAFPIPRQEVA